MKKGRGRKRLIVCLAVLVIAAAVLAGGEAQGPAVPKEGLLRWDIFLYEMMLLAGGYALAAVIGGRRKKRMRRDVSSHVG